MTIIFNSFLYHYNNSVIIEYLLIFIEQTSKDLMLIIKKTQFIQFYFFEIELPSLSKKIYHALTIECFMLVRMFECFFKPIELIAP